ncbi:MAG: alpha-L-rhamnosidase N-terminal domain-containing protein [Bacteroidota bacterium]
MIPGACNFQKKIDDGLLVQNLKCEFLSNPRGMELIQPCLSWEIDAPGRRNILQSSCRIKVYASDEKPEDHAEPLWDSGKVKSGKSVNVRYGGTPLQSATRYYWKVQIEDSYGNISRFSDMAFFETGILDQEDWFADWIHAPVADSTNCPFVRYDFELETLPRFAPAFVASVGFHELYVNGQKVSDAVLTPSVSDLRNRVLYSSYELSACLRKGRNNIVIWLASGWADFSDANPKVDFNIQKRPLCKAQIKIGEEQWIGTDESWKCSPGNTFHQGGWQNSNFGGDLINGSAHNIAWTQSLNDEDQWADVEVVDCGLDISSDFIEPNRLVQNRSALSVKNTGDRKYQVTMDKIYTGWIEARLKGQAGQRISISASSHPDKEVEFNQTNTLVIGPDGEGIFRNRFSYHQVEYVTMEGIDYQPELTDISGYQVTNDRERLGEFTCSNELLNQIYDNTCYTYESLSTGGMTVDCPHRERLGYGGDGHGSMEIAMDAFASHPFFTKWARDWVDIQDETGRINHTAPTLGGGGGPAWSGFILTMPWEVYLNYGDVRILENTFGAARNWLEYLDRSVNDKGLLDIVSPGEWEYSGGDRWLFLGDWANPHENEESHTAEASLFNNCYYVYVLKIASGIADILKLEEAAKTYLKKAGEVRDAVNRSFYDSIHHTYIDTRQTHLVMPLIAGIVPAEDIPEVEKKLREEILVNQDGHFDTGIHGTYFLTKYLSERGYHDLLYVLANQTTYPGYGEIISRGETTWPEYWQKVNSRVHGCLNGIGGWFQRGLLGIRFDPEYPGYKHIIIKPSLIDSLQWAKGQHMTPYGPVEVSWNKNYPSYTLEVMIPENTTASVFIPANALSDITESGTPITDSQDIQMKSFGNAYAEFRIGSGQYKFETVLPVLFHE